MPVFRRREEENRQAQPQLYGTQYFSVRKTLTGQLCGLNPSVAVSEPECGPTSTTENGVVLLRMKGYATLVNHLNVSLV